MEAMWTIWGIVCWILGVIVGTLLPGWVERGSKSIAYRQGQDFGKRIVQGAEADAEYQRGFSNSTEWKQ